MSDSVIDIKYQRYLRRSYKRCRKFLAISYNSSIEDTNSEYRRLYLGRPHAANLYRLVLTELATAISEGNVDNFKQLSRFIIDCLSDVEDPSILRDYYEHSENPVKRSNFVILACKHNNVEILKYLLSDSSGILIKVCLDKRESTILPNDVDDNCLNAFYYAIRSGNTDLVDTLINIWPDNYFSVNVEELDTILSQAYEELKLKNIQLSENVQIFVESKLISIRFFSPPGQYQSSSHSYLSSIRERINLVLQNICLLKDEYSGNEKVDERFLFVAKFIAKNLHILKRRLLSTYGILPWEEIEFCLVGFISSQIKHQQMNLFYNVTLNIKKILSHLDNFGKRLKVLNNNLVTMDCGKFGELPKLNREKVVHNIFSSNPEFEDLYEDYKTIRDVYSLEKINQYVKLASSAEPKEKEGQLIIMRTLQIIGEYLKNTLESPKLSSNTSELLWLTIPKSTRQIIVDLRNSLTHSYFKKTVGNNDVDFFSGIQNDTKIIKNVISDILFERKLTTIIALVKRIRDCENIDELRDIGEIVRSLTLKEVSTDSLPMMQDAKIEKLIDELKSVIRDKEFCNKEFNQIDNILKFANKSDTNSANYKKELESLLGAFFFVEEFFQMDSQILSEMKLTCDMYLNGFPLQMASHSLKKIAELSSKIVRRARLKLPSEKVDELNRISCEIFYIAELGTGDLKWIQQLRDKLYEEASFVNISANLPCRFGDMTNDQQLEQKLSELKSVLAMNDLTEKSIEKLIAFKSNKSLQAVVELRVLDVMSILGGSYKMLENNLLSLDEITPLLTGKCLRNHLAHDNALVDVVLSNSSIATICNAQMLLSDNLLKSYRRVGKLVGDDLVKLRNRFDRNLDIIANQKKMFVAIEEGNFEDLLFSIAKGGDVNARNNEYLTTLHVACRGPSLEMFKFIVEQQLDNKAFNLRGQQPIHIAAENGRKHIVEYFIRKLGVSVNDPALTRQVPLHLAAKNGHLDTIKMLLNNKADKSLRDMAGYSPLHYASKNNHVDVVKFLLENYKGRVDSEANCGYTPLHFAAQFGHLEIVHLLLEFGANVSAKSESGAEPLFGAAQYGHSEIVKLLIVNGANVNARVFDGTTPLIRASESGHEMVANILLENGAKVDAINTTNNNVALHYAARHGHTGIVKALLRHKANGNFTNRHGHTPLYSALMGAHLEIVSALLEHGVDVCVKDKHNISPLHYATKECNAEVVNLLIKYGAEVNGKDSFNRTALNVAAWNGSKDVLDALDVLIRNNAEINAKDTDGDSPLHVFAQRGNKDAIGILIKNKADVNARNNIGRTPLHETALNGHEDAAGFLIKSKAKVNTEDNSGFTPLHSAITKGNKNIVQLLIKNKARINTKGIALTPLHVAANGGNKEIVGMLIENGAKVNVKRCGLTPLTSAIQRNHKEIVKLLIENGARVNEECGSPLFQAVLAGFRDIFWILLKNKAWVNVKRWDNRTPLHLAIERGHKEMAKDLIKMGAVIDAIARDGTTPLLASARDGLEEIAEALLANGADVNLMNALCTAAEHNHINVVKILVKNGAKVNMKSNDGLTPLQQAVSRGHLQLVKTLLQYKQVDINAKGNMGCTVLHLASQANNIEMVKFLVQEGCNVNAKNAKGSKPIHIATREGFKDIVEYFIGAGINVNELDLQNRTLLHYAAMGGHTQVAKYLIAHGSEVSATDIDGLTPIHIGADYGHKEFVKVLLENGAVYNYINNFNLSPLAMSRNSDVTNLLSSTENVFQSVKHNNSSDVEKYIKAGGVVNAKNADGKSSLHYASKEGYSDVVTILLQNNANVNAVNNMKFTALHYAAKFSHATTVKDLLARGAVYNAVSDTGKTPCDLTVDEDLISLFKLIEESFQNIKIGNSQVIDDLNKIVDINTVKAVMNALDEERRSLLTFAIQNKFANVEELKQISLSGISARIKQALLLNREGNYEMALNIFRKSFEISKETLGVHNPGTLELQENISQVLFTQGEYQESLILLKDILQKQTEILGLYDPAALLTRAKIGQVLRTQGKNEEALQLLREVHEKQNEILGQNDPCTLKTQLCIASILDQIGKHEEALALNRGVLESSKKVHGVYHPCTVEAQSNIAKVLFNKGEFGEFFKYQEKDFVTKQIVGTSIVDEFTKLSNVAQVAYNTNMLAEALKAYQLLYEWQKKVLVPNHPDTLDTQYKIAKVIGLAH